MKTQTYCCRRWLAESLSVAKPLPLLYRSPVSLFRSPFLVHPSLLSLRSFSSPVQSPFELAAIRALQKIPAPPSASQPSSPPMDIFYSGHVSSVSYDSSVSTVVVTLRPTVEFRDLKSRVVTELETELKKLSDKIKVSVVMARPTPPPVSPSSATSAGLSRVKHLIAVSSCKGGVGKSTVALNIALALSEGEKKRVGILDADVHGPSLPTLINLDNDIVGPSESEQTLIDPLKYRGIALMSYGYLNRGNVKSAAIMRGAMVSNVIRDLLVKTNWSILDYLVIDMPPGTGDVAITLMQSLNLAGAIVVTAPQRLAYLDVIKGIELFVKTRVPIISLVENFSYFQCHKCDEKHFIFGESHSADIMKEYGKYVKEAHQIPICKEINDSCDKGTPFFVDMESNPSATQSAHRARKAYSALAASIITQTSPKALAEHPFLQKYSLQFDAATPSVTFVVNDRTKEKTKINNRELRFLCRCAACVDERTGERKFQLDMVADDIRPVQMEKKGNYAVGFHWSDGHKSTILGWEEILQLANNEGQKHEGKPQTQTQTQSLN